MAQVAEHVLSCVIGSGCGKMSSLVYCPNGSPDSNISLAMEAEKNLSFSGSNHT
jgi:hypothetical protein